MLRAESAKACIEELGYAAPNKAALPLLDEALRNNPGDEETRYNLALAKELLEKANVRIIGATLTNAPRETTINGYYE